MTIRSGPGTDNRLRVAFRVAVAEVMVRNVELDMIDWCSASRKELRSGEGRYFPTWSYVGARSPRQVAFQG